MQLNVLLLYSHRGGVIEQLAVTLHTNPALYFYLLSHNNYIIVFLIKFLCSDFHNNNYFKKLKTKKNYTETIIPVYIFFCL